MSERVLVLCPSRGRLPYIKDMIASVLETAEVADIAVYVNDRRPKAIAEYEYLGSERVFVRSGPQLSVCASLDHLISEFPGYAMYGVGPDDCVFLTKAWDSWALAQRRRFSHGAAVIAPFFGKTGRMDFPFVTDGWLKAAGRMSLPDTEYYYWDIALQVVAEQCSRIVFASQSEFAIHHRTAIGSDDREPAEAHKSGLLNAFSDARKVCVWMQDQRFEEVEMIKSKLASEVAYV